MPPALKPEIRAKALGREATESLLDKSGPHQRGFGTADRFQISQSTTMPGPYTSGAELQLVSGFNSLIVCKRTKAQSFSVTNKRFLTNEAITAAMQNLPDAMNPAPNRNALQILARVSLLAYPCAPGGKLKYTVRVYRYTIKSQFDLSERRGVVRRPNSRAAAGAIKNQSDQKANLSRTAHPVCAVAPQALRPRLCSLR